MGTTRIPDIFERQSPATASAAASTEPGLTAWSRAQTAHADAVKKSAAAMSEVARGPFASSVGQKA